MAEFARVYKAEHRVEECLQRAKSEAGLADYQVRTWEGWHHHQTLSLIATWFLTEETRREKKTYSSDDSAAGAGGNRSDAAPAVGMRSPGTSPAEYETPIAAQRGGKAVSLEEAQPLTTTAV